MNSDALAQVIQKGFRVTLGATATLVEALQDPQKRDANWAKLSGNNWDALAEEWEAKGAVTEQEARTLVDTLVTQLGQRGLDKGTDGTPRTINTTATIVTDPSIQADLRDLTEQIAAMRAEIDRLKNAP